MKSEERRLVRRDQINNFLDSYFSNWRLNQILTIEKLCIKKYDFFNDIILETKQLDDITGEATIAQEITNGLFFDAISNSIQFIEDLFALLNAAKNPDFFINNIITYKAGKIEALIKRKYSLSEICKLFYFPFYEDAKGDTEVEKNYTESINRLSNYITDLQEYYKKYHFFYTQYKHGLTIALRPYRVYNKRMIDDDKEGKHKPYLVAFDNLALNKLKGIEDIRFNNIVFMPGFTEPIRRNLDQLHAEDNLTRFVFPPEDTTFEKIKTVAFKTKACIETIITNLATFVNEKSYNLHLPSDNFGSYVMFKFDANPFDKEN